VPEPAANLVKRFAFGGLIFGEIYWVLVCLAPNAKGTPAPPADAIFMRLAAGAIFMGPFGAAVGVGLGLLATALVAQFRKRNNRQAEQPPEKP
jgi:hypothetical protein